MSTQHTNTSEKTQWDPAVEHRYNDDLLLTKEVREEAISEFSQISFLLDDPDLRESFQLHDCKANRAKKKSQIAGFYAVVFALLALMGASSDPIWGHATKPWPSIIAVVSGILGLAAVVIGASGILAGRRKIEWLHNRLFTERLRQFHFQGFLWQLPNIAEARANEAGRQQFLDSRRKQFNEFCRIHDGQLDSQLSAILDPSITTDVWLHEATGQHTPKLPADFDPKQLFSAYRKLRFLEQWAYANHKLGSAVRGPNFFLLPLRIQQKFLRFVWSVGFGGLVLFHVTIVAGYIGHWQVVHEPWLHVGVIWLALFALAARTLEEGFALSREVERYEEYRAIIRDLIVRFDNAPSDQLRLELMVEMEREAFEEMRSFLRSNNEAAYIL